MTKNKYLTIPSKNRIVQRMSFLRENCLNTTTCYIFANLWSICITPTALRVKSCNLETLIESRF